jgi:hypothetical protein
MLLATLVAFCFGCAAPTATRMTPHGVIGINDQHLTADHWIRKARQARQVVLSEQAIAAQNERLAALDPSFNELEKLPAELPGEDVRERIRKLSSRPIAAIFEEEGLQVSSDRLDEIEANAALEAVPDTQPVRYGMVVQRANVRSFPTNLRVFRAPGDTDIDRFQESALFPGTPVAILHTSKDGVWYFVMSLRYAAWIERQYVAEGSAEEVFGYVRKTPYVVVTGATARTVYTRERPELSELQLEMGARVPLIADWPADRPVNGQHPYTSYVVELPWRDRNGALRFSPALLPKTADVAPDYLPLSRANVIRQGFKFLGERYGWCHSYNARDCSGFVSEVYRSFGAQLPRNTRDQATSPALQRIVFDEKVSNEERMRVLQRLDVGDLVYIPGHVMMVIGYERGVPYVIHDTTGISYRDNDGEIRRVTLNGVAVTPLTPLLGGEHPIVESIYSIVLMRPR